jgi:hypothetical protein
MVKKRSTELLLVTNAGRGRNPNFVIVERQESVFQLSPAN